MTLYTQYVPLKCLIIDKTKHAIVNTLIVPQIILKLLIIIFNTKPNHWTCIVMYNYPR